MAKFQIEIPDQMAARLSVFADQLSCSVTDLILEMAGHLHHGIIETDSMEHVCLCGLLGHARFGRAVEAYQLECARGEDVRCATPTTGGADPQGGDSIPAGPGDSPAGPG